MELGKWTEDLGEEQWGLRLASALFFFGMVVVSSIAPIGHNSESHPMPINPAGYAFSIWFIIWLFQGTGVVYGLFPGGSAAKLNGIEALGVYAPLGWLTLLVWATLQFFQKDWPVFSNALLIIALMFFLVAYERITSQRYATDIVAPFAALLHDPSSIARWHAFGSALFHWSIYYLPTAMILTWLLLASCISASSVAVQLGWVGVSAPALPVALIVLADVVGLYFAGQARWPDATVPMVVVWGLSAVIVNGTTTPEIITACWVSVGVVGYSALVALTAAATTTEHYRAAHLHSCGNVNHECSPLLTAP